MGMSSFISTTRVSGSLSAVVMSFGFSSPAISVFDEERVDESVKGPPMAAH